MTLRLVHQLQHLLEELLELSSSSEPRKRDRLLFAFYKKKSIEQSCEELEKWHGRFLRHFWISVMLETPTMAGDSCTAAVQSRMLSRVRRMQNAIMNPDQVVNSSQLRLPAFSADYATAQLPGSSIAISKDRLELVEFRNYSLQAPSQTIDATELLVRDLAARLHHIDPSTMGLLHCNGFTHDKLNRRFAVRFRYPAEKGTAQTLHSLLVHKSDNGAQHPLSERVTLARKLASAVLYMHACEFVHKSIRPDNVLIFENSLLVGDEATKQKYPYVIGEPFLVGFDSIRKAVAASYMIRVEDWKKNIYLHPDRHRMGQGDEYTVRHDLYSLGVVLLEIALWRSFADELPGGAARYVWSRESPKTVLSPEALKAMYLRFARDLVPRYIGVKYASIVVSCLEGLKDEEEKGLLKDKDDLVVGTAYVSQILERLEEISL
jgi:hypothetical protein